MAHKYEGPIIDSHHHFWDLDMGRHLWITDPSPAVAARIGNRASFQRDYLPSDYVRDTANQPIVASVHIEAVWDRARNPIEETDWLDIQERPDHIGARYISYVPFDHPDTADIMARQLSHSRVAGLRGTLGWNVDPQKKGDPDRLIRDPIWRNALDQLKRHDLLFELMTSPHEANALSILAAECPDQIFVVNHCCGPHEDTSATLIHWKAAITLLARSPNVMMKVSEPWRYSLDDATARGIVEFCIDRFGASRCLFGSNFPVAKRTGMSFDRICDRMRDYLSTLSDERQRAVFHDNAKRLYRI
jgi:predicted TIM-barrel fold metal-dependent hydrolase